MAKPKATRISAAEEESLRNTAALISKRVQEVVVTPAKERALELARLVLANEPKFGGREMGDKQVITLLEAEQIGLPTFKKALTTARKELVKKPVRVKPDQFTKSDRQNTTKAKVVPAKGNASGVATNVGRNLL